MKMLYSMVSKKKNVLFCEYEIEKYVPQDNSASLVMPNSDPRGMVITNVAKTCDST